MFVPLCFPSYYYHSLVRWSVFPQNLMLLHFFLGHILVQLLSKLYNIGEYTSTHSSICKYSKTPLHDQLCLLKHCSYVKPCIFLILGTTLYCMCLGLDTSLTTFLVKHCLMGNCLFATLCQFKHCMYWEESLETIMLCWVLWYYGKKKLLLSSMASSGLPTFHLTDSHYHGWHINGWTSLPDCQKSRYK